MKSVIEREDVKMYEDKMYKRVRKFLDEVIGLTKDEVQVVVNIGDRIRYMSMEVQPLVTYSDKQYLLVGNLPEIWKWLETEVRKYGKFILKSWYDISYMREDKVIYIGTFRDFLVLHIMLGIKEFYAYSDFDEARNSNVACVGYVPEERTYYGWTHRAIGFFRVGDKIEYSPDLLILSHGYVEGSFGYEREKERVGLVKSWFKDGVLIIDSEEKAKMLAFRIAEATS